MNVTRGSSTPEFDAPISHSRSGSSTMPSRSTATGTPSSMYDPRQPDAGDVARCDEARQQVQLSIGPVAARRVQHAFHLERVAGLGDHHDSGSGQCVREVLRSSSCGRCFRCRFDGSVEVHLAGACAERPSPGRRPSRRRGAAGRPRRASRRGAAASCVNGSDDGVQGLRGGEFVVGVAVEEVEHQLVRRRPPRRRPRAASRPARRDRGRAARRSATRSGRRSARPSGARRSPRRGTSGTRRRSARPRPSRRAG